MKFPRPRILPFAIALTIISMGFRTVDVISLAVSGQAFSTVSTASAETTNADSAATDTSKKAVAVPSKADDKSVQIAAAEAPQPGLPSHPPITSPDDSKSATELLADITARRKALDDRQKELDQREALMKAAEDRIDHKVSELNEMRGELEKLLDIQKTKDDAQMASLVKIYENMKPRDAAAIFDSLELPILVEVSGRMKEGKVAPILGAMSPDRARVLTVKLAERRRTMDGAVADAHAALGDPNAKAPDATPEAVNGTPIGGN
jgi:flagellar motility protein MotE (MotC chaperone)